MHRGPEADNGGENSRKNLAILNQISWRNCVQYILMHPEAQWRIRKCTKRGVTRILNIVRTATMSNSF